MSFIFESDNGALESFAKEKASIEYVYKRTADLIRAGRDPEGAQAEVIKELKAMEKGEAISEEDAEISGEGE
jgi:chromosome condensin MukBEF MukE localization factor